MIHPSTRVAAVSPEVGDGVFATELIPRGTIVWTQDALDAVITARMAKDFPRATRSMLERYAHIDDKGRYVLCWDAGKIINHSCRPNLRGVGTWFQVARRDIDPGEEITCDYAECNIQSALSCHCGLPDCRGRVHADDLLGYSEQWDAEATELLALIATVDQPLWPHLLDASQVQDYLDGTTPLPSFRSLYAGNLDDAIP